MDRERLTLTELFRHYLETRKSWEVAGLAPAAVAEVLPHEGVSIRPIVPAEAWQSAQGAAHYLAAAEAGEPATPPPDWPALVAAQEPQRAVAFCLGNYPQLVRSLAWVLDSKAGQGEAEGAGRPLAVPQLLDWCNGRSADLALVPRCLAAGVLRLARHYDHAAAMLAAADQHHPLVANEQAALRWHRGERKAALASWRAQPDSAPVLFNRGMAELFVGRKAAARAALGRAVELVPDTDPWHHLGRLYLTLASLS
ncbi:MAG: hypothetical protein NZ700_10480 [Gemmataceae bacterium]|nr:hypothetical protein [Gemmataceae bacterium]MDW8265834.1 hypothetical protein [Gemmataceae bacterium]